MSLLLDGMESVLACVIAELSHKSSLRAAGQLSGSFKGLLIFSVMIPLLQALKA